METKSKIFLFFCSFIIACNQPSKEELPPSKDSTYFLMFPDSVSNIFDSTKTDTTVHYISNSDADKYVDTKEDNERNKKMKVRTKKVTELKDTVNSISIKLDNICKRLKE